MLHLIKTLFKTVSIKKVVRQGSLFPSSILKEEQEWVNSQWWGAPRGCMGTALFCHFWDGWMLRGHQHIPWKLAGNNNMDAPYRCGSLSQDQCRESIAPWGHAEVSMPAASHLGLVSITSGVSAPLPQLRAAARNLCFWFISHEFNVGKAVAETEAGSLG